MMKTTTRAYLLVLAMTIPAASAYAADLQARAPVYKASPAAPYNWTGFYAGGYAGYGWGKSVATDIGDSGGTPWYVLGGKITGRPDGFIGGAQAGFNVQSGQWVWGFETDFGYLGLKGKSVYNAGALDTFLKNDGTYDATFRARLGIAQGASLFYVTGGAIVADFGSSIPSFGGLSSGKTGAQWGWTIGAGIEHALDRNWSVKGEYLYYDAGSKTVTLANNPFPVENTGNLVRVGLNYRFGN